jgi:hypothetical protein
MNIPRILWLKKSWTLHQIHLEVFRFFLGSLEILYSLQQPPFRKPGETDTGDFLTKEEFFKLRLEEQFAAAFSGLKEGAWKEFLKRNDIPYSEALYSLRLRNMSGYMESCHFCGDKRCDGCPLPYDKELTLADLMAKMGDIKTNQSLYMEGYKRGRQDVILEAVWNNKIDKGYFDSFQTAVSFPNQPKQQTETQTQGAITLADCLEEFERPE